MAYLASRRIMLCLVGRVMPYMSSRRTALLLRLWSLRWTDFFLPLACRGTLLRVSEVCGNVRKVWWRSLHSGQSPHDGGERFFTLGLTRNGNGLCNYCKVNVCAITIRFAVIVTLRTPHCLRIVLSPLALLIVLPPLGFAIGLANIIWVFYSLLEGCVCALSSRRSVSLLFVRHLLSLLPRRRFVLWLIAFLTVPPRFA